MHARGEATELLLLDRRTIRLPINLELRRGLRHVLGDRRLGGGRGDIKQTDRIRRVHRVRRQPEKDPIRPVAKAIRHDWREVVGQRSRHTARIRATASHDDVLGDRVAGDAKALLDVRHLGLRAVGALCGIQHREYGADHGDHDGGGYQHFRERETGFGLQAVSHCDFLVFTVTRRASSGNNVPGPLFAAPRSVLRKTSTCRISVLLGFDGSGSTDQRRT